MLFWVSFFLEATRRFRKRCAIRILPIRYPLATPMPTPNLNKLLTGDGLARRGQFDHLSHLKGKFPKSLHNGIQQPFPCDSPGEWMKIIVSLIS